MGAVGEVGEGVPDLTTFQGEEAGNVLDDDGMGASGDGDLSCAHERESLERKAEGEGEGSRKAGRRG